VKRERERERERKRETERAKARKREKREGGLGSWRVKPSLSAGGYPLQE